MQSSIHRVTDKNKNQGVIRWNKNALGDSQSHGVYFLIEEITEHISAYHL